MTADNLFIAKYMYAVWQQQEITQNYIRKKEKITRLGKCI